MKRELMMIGLVSLWGASGCYERSAPAAPPPAAAHAPASAGAATSGTASSGAGSSASASGAMSSSAAQQAAGMDARTPVPLLPMMAEHQKEQMRGHLAAVQEIVAALARNDFAAIGEASRKIGYSDSMAAMCTHMGAAAPGFTPTALNFHRTADRIGAAAKKKDRAAVLAALDATLGTCVGCHATYKQQIVDAATWSKLTASAPPGGEHGASCPMMQAH